LERFSLFWIVGKKMGSDWRKIELYALEHHQIDAKKEFIGEIFYWLKIFHK